ncbi:MAG: hypothetical protein WCQ99_13445 [Pseudomonadota bacterium]
MDRALTKPVCSSMAAAAGLLEDHETGGQAPAAVKSSISPTSSASVRGEISGNLLSHI